MRSKAKVVLTPKWGNTKAAKAFYAMLRKVPIDWGVGFERYMAKVDILVALQREKYNRRKRGA